MASVKFALKRIIQKISRNSIVWKATGPDDVSYLTFDDGPTAGVTDRILDLLDTHCAKATFFVVGKNMENDMGLTREIHNRGHLLCNHSFSHTKEIYGDYGKL